MSESEAATESLINRWMKEEVPALGGGMKGEKER